MTQTCAFCWLRWATSRGYIQTVSRSEQTKQSVVDVPMYSNTNAVCGSITWYRYIVTWCIDISSRLVGHNWAANVQCLLTRPGQTVAAAPDVAGGPSLIYALFIDRWTVSVFTATCQPFCLHRTLLLTSGQYRQSDNCFTLLSTYPMSARDLELCTPSCGLL